MNKKKKMYALIATFVAVIAAIVIIFAISHKKDISDITNNLEETKNNSTNNQEITGNLFENHAFSDSIDDGYYYYITESSDYFYTATDEGWNNLVYKINKKTGMAELICMNPQCMHTDETCGACLKHPASAQWINYYKGRLYYTEWFDEDGLIDEEWLMSMDLEGKDRRKEIKINEAIVNREEGWSTNIDAYGRDMYLTKLLQEPDEDNIERSLKIEIYRMNLETNDMIKIFEKTQYDVNGFVVGKENNIVYIELLYTDYDKGMRYASILEYDENTGKISDEEPSGSNVFIGVSGGNIYYSTPYENEGRVLVKKSGSDEYEEVMNLGKNGTQCAISVYRDYIVVNNWPDRNKTEGRYITVYDIEGNFIKKIDMTDHSVFTKIANGFLFSEKRKENEDDQCYIYACPIEGTDDTWIKLNN